MIELETKGGDDCKCDGESTVLGVSCTSMSFVLGAEAIDAQLKAFNKNVAVTDMARTCARSTHDTASTRVRAIVVRVGSPRASERRWWAERVDLNLGAGCVSGSR